MLPRGEIDEVEYLRWLPTSKQLIVSGFVKGKRRIYIQEIEGGLPKPIAPEDFSLCAAPLTSDDRYCVGCSKGQQYLIPVNGGGPKPVPGLKRGNEVIGFSSDSRFAYVQALDSLPARIDRIDVTTGERSEWKTFQPSNLAGITAIGPILLSADLKAYAYNYESIISDLYTLDGPV